MQSIFSNIETVAEKIRPILSRDDKLEAAYLLGSIVNGSMHPQSDIDLAILPLIPKSYSAYDRLKLSARLQDELGCDIDVGVLGTHDVVYAAQTILKGECIYFRDRYKKDLFAATCLSLYFDLKRQRLEVENAYQAG